eukprot:1360805-Pleurochrysis_carterae.AAC.1
MNTGIHHIKFLGRFGFGAWTPFVRAKHAPLLSYSARWRRQRQRNDLTPTHHPQGRRTTRECEIWPAEDGRCETARRAGTRREGFCG